MAQNSVCKKGEHLSYKATRIFIYQQHFHKQRQAEIGKKLSKC